MDAERGHRIRQRDAALGRLRSLTTIALAGAGVLAVGFAGLAAKAFPGRKTGTPVRAAATHTVKRAPRPTRTVMAATPPPLVAVHTAAPAPPPSPTPSPAPAPTPTPAPPVVVSGGS